MKGCVWGKLTCQQAAAYAHNATVNMQRLSRWANVYHIAQLSLVCEHANIYLFATENTAETEMSFALQMFGHKVWQVINKVTESLWDMNV